LWILFVFFGLIFFSMLYFLWKAAVVLVAAFLLSTLKRFQITFIVDKGHDLESVFYARQINMSNFVSMNDNMSNWCFVLLLFLVVLLLCV